MVYAAAILATIATTILFLTTLTIALLGAERGRRAEVAHLERQVADLIEKTMTPAEREERARRHRERAARQLARQHGRQPGHELYVD